MASGVSRGDCDGLDEGFGNFSSRLGVNYLLKARTPPNAEIGSASKALR